MLFPVIIWAKISVFQSWKLNSSRVSSFSWIFRYSFVLLSGNVHCDFSFNFRNFKHENKHCTATDLNIRVFCPLTLLNSLHYTSILCLFGINSADDILSELLSILFFERERYSFENGLGRFLRGKFSIF